MLRCVEKYIFIQWLIKHCLFKEADKMSSEKKGMKNMKRAQCTLSNSPRVHRAPC